jgi:hypothetical protein
LSGKAQRSEQGGSHSDQNNKDAPRSIHNLSPETTNKIENCQSFKQVQQDNLTLTHDSEMSTENQ